jgi:hypothetical protein
VIDKIKKVDFWAKNKDALTRNSYCHELLVPLKWEITIPQKMRGIAIPSGLEYHFFFFKKKSPLFFFFLFKPNFVVLFFLFFIFEKKNGVVGWIFFLIKKLGCKKNIEK